MKKFLFLLSMLIWFPSLAQDFQYTFKDKTIIYTILDKYNRTCKIKDYAFRDSHISGELILPDSVIYNGEWFSLKSIGVMSFANCSELTMVEIPKSVETIEDLAFENCNNIKSILFGNSVRIIGDNAFNGCSGLRALEIPNSVQEIGKGAFFGCNGIGSLLIGESVNVIGQYAFKDCDKSLIKYAYPSSFQKDPISKGYFSNPYGVKYDCRVSVVENGCVYGNNKETLYFASIILDDKYKIPNTVKTIKKNTFQGCNGLISVEIPNSVETIEDYAFSDCKRIKSLHLGNSVKTIGKRAFSFCTDLEMVEIPNSVETIQDYAFDSCVKLASVIIGTSVKNMGTKVFGITGIVKCAYPNTISYPFDESGAKYVVCYDPKQAIFENGWIYGPNKESVYFAPTTLKGDYHISDSVVYIGNDAFSGCTEITSIEIPNSVRSIGNFAFYDCIGMKSLLIGNSVKTIGRGAFSNCYALQTVEIPNSVQTIGDLTCYEDSAMDKFKIAAMGAFSNCSALTSIVIPNSVHTIGNCTFSNCTGLESIQIGNTVKNIGIGAFSNCCALASVEIPNSVESVGLTTLDNDKGIDEFFLAYLSSYIDIGAFSNCSGLTTVKIPNSVSTLGDYAFSNCTGLESIKIGNTVKTIGENAFNNCTALRSVEIPNSVEIIGSSAFSGCSTLQSAVMGNSVKSIEECVFCNCTTLKSFEIPNSVETIGTSAFSGCTALQSVVIGNTVKTIGENAFSNCTSLTSVEIPNSVETIGAFAFYYCSGIKSLSIGNSVKDIGSGAFRNCSSLPSLELPCSIETIGYFVFKGCESLSSLECKAITPPNVYEDSFDEVTYNNCLLKVPETSEVIYKQNAVWGRFTIESLKIGIYSIELVPNNWEGEVGSTFRLTAIIKPANATNKSLLWTSSDDSIATVDKEGIITTKKAGKVIITATALDGSGVSACCNVDVMIIPVSGVSLNTYLVEILTGETFQLVATVTPENATDKSIEWSSSDETVATVDGNGLITAQNAGNTIIAATVADSYGVHGTFCRVIVKDTSSIMNTLNDYGLSVRSEASKIIINDVANGCPITVYNFDGNIYHSEFGTGADVCINVISGQAYIVKIDTRTFKIIAQ